ncbi:MAG: AI-2E family transporter [bacterium]
MNSIKIVISSRSIILVILFLILVWLIYQAKDVILLLFASFVIASALSPVVDWLSKKMPRAVAVSIIYVLGFIILATILIPLCMVLIEQTQEFLKQIPVYLNEVERFADKWQIVSKNFGVFNFSHILSYTANLGENIVNQSINITISFFTGIIAAFTLAVIVLYLLLDKQEVKTGFLKFFPEKTREKTEFIINIISKKVGGYVRGQLLLMLAVGLLTALGLFIIRIDFALLLGLLAAILEIVPIIGPVLSAIPAIIIALAKNPVLAFSVIGVYFVVQRIENNFLTPLILGKFLDMHPLIIIIVLLLAASTLGIIGVVLAPAIAAAAYVLIQELYLNKINQKKDIIEL